MKQLSQSTKYLIYAAIFLAISIYAYYHNEYLKTEYYKILLPIKGFIHEKMIPDVNSIMNLKKQNKQLKEENKNLQITINHLKKQLDMGQKINNIIKKFQIIPHIEKVIGFEQGIFDSSIIISKTSPSPPNSIVTANNNLVGIVAYSSEKYTLVKSITDSRTVVPVKTKSGERLILRGTNNNKLEAVEIKNNNIKININETLYTSGEGGLFPANIPVATVISASKTEVISKPIISILTIDLVEISEAVCDNYTLTGLSK